LSARVVSDVAYRIALNLAPAGGWLMGGTPADAAAASHLDAEVRLLNLSAGAILVWIRRTRCWSSPRQAQRPATRSRASRGGTNSTLSRYVGTERQLAPNMVARVSGSGAVAAGLDARPASLLLPVSIARIWAAELVADGRLIRFERDPDGSWFHHVDGHVCKPGGFAHRADPATAPLIATELAGVDQSSTETVVIHKPDDAAMSGVGPEHTSVHPSNILLLYSRVASRPVARIELGGPAKDGLSRYARDHGE
jgi:hypothetical protein